MDGSSTDLDWAHRSPVTFVHTIPVFVSSSWQLEVFHAWCMRDRSNAMAAPMSRNVLKRAPNALKRGPNALKQAQNRVSFRLNEALFCRNCLASKIMELCHPHDKYKHNHDRELSSILSSNGNRRVLNKFASKDLWKVT